jgi:hypothetical protein
MRSIANPDRTQQMWATASTDDRSIPKISHPFRDDNPVRRFRGIHREDQLNRCSFSFTLNSHGEGCICIGDDGSNLTGQRWLQLRAAPNGVAYRYTTSTGEI